MLVKLKSGGFVAPDEKFREAARLVLRSAKRKYGSAYWFHPLIGKFQMIGDSEMKSAPNLKHLPKEKYTEAVILLELMHTLMQRDGKKARVNKLPKIQHLLSILGQSNWRN